MIFIKKCIRNNIYIYLIIIICFSIKNCKCVNYGFDLSHPLTQHGITWYFDKEYKIGQFVNGDYFIIGPAKILAVNPNPSNGRNGSMVNPPTGTHQAYDNRAYYYDSNYHIEFPYEMSPGESLVSTISRTTETVDYAGRSVGSSSSYIASAAVLTCVDIAPPEGSFRPPYIGDTKTLYNVSQLNESILPNLPMISDKPEKWWIQENYIEYFKRSLQRPWIIHLQDFTCRDIHPMGNMPNYHAQIAEFWSEVSLSLCTDDLNTSDKHDIIILYVQTGIDFYHMCINGSGDSAFNKIPVLLTGLLLNNSDMYNFVNAKYTTREDRMTYYITEEQSPYTSSIVSNGEIWTDYNTTSPRPAWAQDRENHEHEHLAVSEWYMISDGGGQKCEAYRAINSPTYVGQMLTALIIGAKDIWDHPAFFDYVDRWMNEEGTYVCGLVSAVLGGQQYGNPDSSLYQTGGTEFIDTMWDEYRNDY